MRLKSLKRTYYAGRSLVPGDEFDAVDKDARLLMLARAASEVLPELQDEAKPEKRRYKRRDLEAEE